MFQQRTGWHQLRSRSVTKLDTTVQVAANSRMSTIAATNAGMAAEIAVMTTVCASITLGQDPPPLPCRFRTRESAPTSKRRRDRVSRRQIYGREYQEVRDEQAGSSMANLRAENSQRIAQPVPPRLSAHGANM